MENITSPYIAIPVLIFCFAKIALSPDNDPADSAIVVALADEAIVEFIPEGE